MFESQQPLGFEQLGAPLAFVSLALHQVPLSMHAVEYAGGFAGWRFVGANRSLLNFMAVLDRQGN